MNNIELIPQNGRKSFYGKAQVLYTENSDRILFSYGVQIMTIRANGKMVKHWNSWTNTTGAHINSFSGLKKKDYMALELE